MKNNSNAKLRHLVHYVSFCYHNYLRKTAQGFIFAHSSSWQRKHGGRGWSLLVTLYLQSGSREQTGSRRCYKPSRPTPNCPLPNGPLPAVKLQTPKGISAFPNHTTSWGCSNAEYVGNTSHSNHTEQPAGKTDNMQGRLCKVSRERMLKRIRRKC